MTINGTSRTYFIAAAVLASALVVSSCGWSVSKGDVYQAIGKGIQRGADKSEVKKYLESLRVKGVKAAVSDYLPNTSRPGVVAPDGQGVIYGGHMSADFNNVVRGGPFSCGTVFALFYFDESGKLMTYHIDC